MSIQSPSTQGSPCPPHSHLRHSFLLSPEEPNSIFSLAMKTLYTAIISTVIIYHILSSSLCFLYLISPNVPGLKEALGFSINSINFLGIKKVKLSKNSGCRHSRQDTKKKVSSSRFATGQRYPEWLWALSLIKTCGEMVGNEPIPLIIKGNLV